MNRQIKFRAWIKSKKENWLGCDNYDSFDWENRMRNVSSIHFPLGSFSGKDISCEAICENDNYANGWHGIKYDECDLMQFTGLKDNNGKELYENDIVTHIAREHSYIIIFHNHSFCAKHISTGNIGGLERLKEIEIIGNIYENPDLLK